MSKAVLNQTAFSLKILALLGLLFLSKVSKNQKADLERKEKQNLTISSHEPISPRVMPVNATGPLPLSY